MRKEKDTETVGSEVRVHASRSFAGPLPPPETLARYNDVVLGAGERILVMAEKQQEHRQYLERRVISANIMAQQLGAILGFMVAMTAICGGVYLVSTGMQVSGLASIITALVALVAVFLYGKQTQRKELSVKSRSSESQ